MTSAGNKLISQPLDHCHGLWLFISKLLSFGSIKDNTHIHYAGLMLCIKGSLIATLLRHLWASIEALSKIFCTSCFWLTFKIYLIWADLSVQYPKGIYLGLQHEPMSSIVFRTHEPPSKYYLSPIVLCSAVLKFNSRFALYHWGISRNIAKWKLVDFKVQVWVSKHVAKANVKQSQSF